MNQCPHCGKNLVGPMGQTNAPYLVVGEFPGREEIRTNVVFSGNAGEVFKSEAHLAGIPMHKVILANLWQHEKTENRDCLDYFTRELYELMKGRTHVLLLGSDLGVLFGYSVLEYSGLWIENPLLPRSAKFMVCPNPALVFHSTVGEVRHAIQEFAKGIKNG